MKKGEKLYIPTLGYNKRVNCFITLFWPEKKIIWNCFKRRRNIEFRKHLANLATYAKRHKLKRIILFIDHASYHKTPKVKVFLKEHPIFKPMFLGKKDPNYNPTERLVNKRLSSAVSVNRSYKNLEELSKQIKKYLSKYNLIYAT